DLITLTLRTSNDATNATPNFAPLNNDFQVMGQQEQQSSALSIVNGRSTSTNHRDYILTLKPRRLGNLVIPPLQVGQYRTQPINISVQRQSAAQQQQMNQFVFLQTQVDSDEVYVQSLIYTVKLFHTAGIGGNFSVNTRLADAVVEIIDKERRYQQVVNGRTYFVLEMRIAIFPQSSGELALPPENFVGTRGQGGLVSQRQRVAATSTGHRVQVKPKPGSFTGQNWIPARSLTIAEKWAAQPPVFTLGEPVNRQLTIVGVGLSESLLPPLDDLEIADAKIYTDPPTVNKQVTPDGIIAQQVTTIGIVPTKEGELTLPEIRIPWWNTVADREEVAVIPGGTYQVLPSTGVNLTTPTITVPLGAAPTKPVVVNPLWQYLAAGLGFLWLVSTWQWLALRRQVRILRSAEQREYVATFDDPDESRLYEELVKACKSNWPAKAHRGLLLWARARYPRVRSLGDLAAGNAALAEAIQMLEACLYRGEDDDDDADKRAWRGAQLA
ncbi:MAG: BatD family protein, partial [Pseudomonadales bacterium]